MRFVCDCCHDLTNIEADRMEIQGDKLIVYSRGQAGVRCGSRPDHAGEADAGEG